MKSMTGFGKASCEIGGRTLTVEVRSLNSKGADINLRLPSTVRNYEADIRGEVTRKLERGKIDVSMNFEGLGAELGTTINVELAKAYHAQLKALAEALGENLNNPLSQVLNMPDVMKSEKKEADEKEWEQIQSCLNEAFTQLNTFRTAEGTALLNDLTNRINAIENLLKDVESADVNRLQNMRERLKKNVVEVIGNEKMDPNRFEQELIYYFEKLDINEEKVRLRTHLNYFISTAKEPSSGRKLAFIGQEIGREINTIGSKANDATIQKLVVQMKDELEKIKEQCNNVL